MKPLLPGLLALLLVSVISCTKTTNVSTTIHDTTTQIFKDTTVIKDTTVVKDTVWEKTPRNPIVGLWVGTFKAFGDAIDSFYYSFAIDSNGMMITSDINASSSSSSAGPWQLHGTAFTATLTALNGVTPESVQAVTAVYDSVAGTLSGQVIYTQGSGLNVNILLLRVE